MRELLHDLGSLAGVTIGTIALIASCQATATDKEADRSKHAENVRWWEPDGTLKILNASPAPIYELGVRISLGALSFESVTRRVELDGILEPCRELTIPVEAILKLPSPAEIDGLFFSENGRQWLRLDADPIELESRAVGPRVLPRGGTEFQRGSVEDVPECRPQV